MSVSIEVSEPSSSKDTAGKDTATRLVRGRIDGVFPSGCPSRVVLDHVTSKWGVLVLLALADGTLRWGQLRRVVQGVSEKMLAQTLQTLERDGLVHREALPVIPPHVEYSLTPLGDDLVDRLLPLMEWLLENSPSIMENASARE